MTNHGLNKKTGVAIVRNQADTAASKGSVKWAAGVLADTLRSQGFTIYEAETTSDVPAVELCILIDGLESASSQQVLQGTAELIPEEPESFGLIQETQDSSPLLVATGADDRGLVYAILELVDRVKHTTDPLAELRSIRQIIEKPANPNRSITRLFVNEIDDKPWYYDKKFWDDYLTELVTHRFNRFSLALGMGYDLGHDPDIRDNYFCFIYPFLVSVPDHNVSLRGLPEEEAERNLEMLRYISAEAKRRGLHFQLGIWSHDYDLSDSPNAKYTVEGLTPDNHAIYCRDALKVLLESCSAIDGVTFRIHYESGIPEPAHEFWRVVMDGVVQSGRQVEIDIHSKGLDHQLIQTAVDTGMPVVVSPKSWAEHMGLPYHQAAIREKEIPDSSTSTVSQRDLTLRSRLFTRYGYADFLQEDRKYDVMFRVWPGTQRLLLWGDPAMAGGYGRFGRFCGSIGVELCEPLSFKSRKGSEVLGGRDPYADTSLQLGGEEWRKYLYTYRLWGRSLYNPDADPKTWRRYLQSEFGDAAESCEEALSHASRILPLVTVFHHPSAANNFYWPEMYANMAIVKEGKSSIYDSDTLEPKTFGSVSPLDPALFYRIDDFAEDLLQGRCSGKYTPTNVANWLDSLADKAEHHLQESATQMNDSQSPAYQRLAVDVAAQAGLGRFFAHKFRAGLAYELFERTGNKELLQQALEFYHSAKEAWQTVVDSTDDVYHEDITFGFVPFMRGQWSDRLAAIEEDISAMEAKYDSLSRHDLSSGKTAVAATKIFAEKPTEERPGCLHTSPEVFRKGEPIELQVTLSDRVREASELHIQLHYRHVNQSERYFTREMTFEEGRYVTTIPAAYTDSAYPLVYFFECQSASGDAWLVPGLEENLSNQPYYVLRQQ